MKTYKEFLESLLTVLLGLMIMVFILSLIAAGETRRFQKEREIYHTWIKATGNEKKLYFEEWQILYHSRMSTTICR